MSRRGVERGGGRRCERGMFYLAMLFAVFLVGLAVGRAMDVYSVSMQREREAELLRVGALYQKAIEDYVLSAPDGRRRYPERLELLLKDPRHLVTRRYLRRLYEDPMTGKAFEPLLAPDGGIIGVVSRSERVPIRRVGPGPQQITGARSYREWRFVEAPRRD